MPNRGVHCDGGYMTTPAQQAASRSNGARSRGPKTAAGKSRSSRNALRHGLLAKTTVLENESREGFEELLRQHIRRIAPRDAVEHSALEEMCSAAWRIRRLWSMERKALDLEIAAQSSPDELERIVNAFDSLARNRPHFLLFHRYETRLHNIIQRSLARIMALRKIGVPNEPEPPIPKPTRDRVGRVPDLPPSRDRPPIPKPSRDRPPIPKLSRDRPPIPKLSRDRKGAEVQSNPPASPPERP